MYLEEVSEEASRSQMIVFDEAAAEYIQHVSVVLEAFGLWLVYTEVKHPDRADRLEAFIDRTAESLKPLEFVKNTSARLGCAFFALLMTLGAFNTLVSHIFSQSETPTWLSYIQQGVGLVVLSPLFFLVLGVCVGFSLGVLKLTLVALDRWSGGRALGSLGVLLAALGFYGEIYQLLTIYLV